MSWTCPLCNSENEDSILRCFCGYEVESKESLTSRQSEGYNQDKAQKEKSKDEDEEDEFKSFFKKYGSFTPLQRVFIGVIIFVSIYGIFSGVFTKSVCLRNYDKINVGMSRSEVEHILGRSKGKCFEESHYNHHSKVERNLGHHEDKQFDNAGLTEQRSWCYNSFFFFLVSTDCKITIYYENGVVINKNYSYYESDITN